MMAIEDVRPIVIISWNNHIPKRDAATPRTAEETMCVMGDVTLMERRLAILMRKPTTPVINEPQRNVVKGVMVSSGSKSSSKPKRSSIIAGTSPTTKIMGIRRIALKRLVYHDSAKALPLTTLRLCLMTTEWMAVMAELATPKKTPVIEIGVPSRKTPMKKPKVTTVHARRMSRDGRAWSMTWEVTTVKGRRRPRATW